MKAASTRSETVPVLFLLLLSLALLAGCGGKNTRDRNPVNGKPTVVSLAPSITEMLYAIGAGDQVIGRTSACDWPVEAAAVTVVGAFGKPSLEMLTSLAPDLVMDVDLAEEQAGGKITELGMQRERLTVRTPDDIPAALRRLGMLTGHSRKADSLALVIEEGLARFRREAETEAEPVKVYLEIWDDPLWTGGKSSYISALIRYAGGTNIGDSVEKEYFEISPEWVIASNPGIIACMYMSKTGKAIDKVAARPGWEHTAAVREGRIYDDFDNSIFLRPGPRVLEGIRRLRDIIRDARS